MLAVYVGGFLRILISYIFLYVRNHDTIGWETVGGLTLLGKNIYPFPAYEYHSFFPAFLYINALGMWFQQHGIAYMLIIKLVCSLFDAGNIYLVYLLSNKNMKSAWLYALNPISIFTISVHGQFESIPLFFLLLAVYFLEKKKVVWSGLAVSFAVVFKTWPLLFTIPLLKRVWKWWYLLIIVVIPATAVVLYSFLFHSKIVDIIHYALFYRGQTGNYGLGYFFGGVLNDVWSLRIFSNGFLLLFAWFAFFNRQKTAQAEILDLMLFFFILSPTMGLQWMMWMVPFLILEAPKWYYIVLAAASLYIGNVNIFWILKEKYLWIANSVTLFGLLTWGSFIWVALSRKLKLRPYIVVAQKDLFDDKKSEKHNQHGK